jgi:methionyl-tRNA formyltransferase
MYNQSMEFSLIFFGSSDYSVPVLQKLIDRKINITGVVTTSDKPVGRHLKLTPNPVKILAQRSNIPVMENITSLERNVIGLVAAYGRIIPPKTLSIFNNHIYNIHPSLLPKYRGPSPLQQQLLDGVKETGVTIIRLDEQIDHGPVIASETDIILPDDTSVSLGTRLFDKGINLFIQKLITENLQTLTPQNDSRATYTKKLTRESGFIPWTDFTGQLTAHNPQLTTKFRAFAGWPGVWTTEPTGKRIKLVSLNPVLIQKEGGKPEPFSL